MRNRKTSAIRKAQNFLRDENKEDASEALAHLASVLEEVENIKRDFQIHIANDLAKEFQRIYDGYLSEAKQPSLNQLLSYVRISDAKQRMQARMSYRLRCLIDDGEIFELY